MIKKNNVSHGLETQKERGRFENGGWRAGMASRTRKQSNHTGRGDSDFQGGSLARSHWVCRPA